MKRIFALFLLLAFPFGAPAVAHDIEHGGIVIDHPIMHPPLGNPSMTVGYMSLLNKGHHDDRLVGVQSDIADRIELHTHKMDGDIMRMRKVDGVDIPAGGKAVFEPGGLHLMIFGLKERLITGDEIEVELEFEQAGKVTAPFWVEPRATPTSKDDREKGKKPGKMDDHSGHMGHH